MKLNSGRSTDQRQRPGMIWRGTSLPSYPSPASFFLLRLVVGQRILNPRGLVRSQEGEPILETL